MIPRPRVSALPSPRPSRIRSPLAPRLCAASTRRAWRVLRPACAPRVARTSMPRCEPWIADDRFQLGYEQGNLTVQVAALVNSHAKSAGARHSRSSNPRTRSAREMSPRRTARSSSFVSISMPMINIVAGPTNSGHHHQRDRQASPAVRRRCALRVALRQGLAWMRVRVPVVRVRAAPLGSIQSCQNTPVQVVVA
jgi:hypothetical protein